MTPSSASLIPRYTLLVGQAAHYVIKVPAHIALVKRCILRLKKQIKDSLVIFKASVRERPLRATWALLLRPKWLEAAMHGQNRSSLLLWLSKSIKL